MFAWLKKLLKGADDMNAQYPEVVQAILLFQEGHNTETPEERFVTAKSPRELQGKIQTMERAGQRFCGFKMINGKIVGPNQQTAAHNYMKQWASYLNQRKGIQQQQPHGQHPNIQPNVQPGFAPAPLQQNVTDGTGFLPPNLDPMTGGAVVQEAPQMMPDPVTGLPTAGLPTRKILSEANVNGCKIRSWSDGTIESEEWVSLTDEEINESFKIEPRKDVASGKIVKGKYNVQHKKWVKKNG